MGRDLDVVLDAGQGAELRFDNHTVIVGILNDLAGDLDVFGKGLGGGVDHDGGEAAVHTGLAGLKVGAVVKVEGNGDVGAFDHSGLNQLDQIGVVGIGAGALGDLEDDGGVLLGAGLSDALHDFHIVDVESTDSVAAVIGLLEHIGGGYQRHSKTLLCCCLVYYTILFRKYKSEFQI